MSSHSNRIWLPVASISLVLLGVSGCTTVQDVVQQGEREFAFDTTAAAKGSDDSYRFQGFLPDDGEDARLLTDLSTGHGAMTWTSSDAFDVPSCEAASVSGDPVVSPSWWPETALPTSGWQCQDWSIVQVDRTFYAWSTPKVAD